MINDSDLKHLRRCIELARTALENGDEPFGSVLVSANGDVLAEDLNLTTPNTRNLLWRAGQPRIWHLKTGKRRQYIPRANIVLCALLPMDGLVWDGSLS